MNTNSGALLIPSPAPRTGTNLAVGTDIRDIKGPIEIPSDWAWLGWTLVVLAVATAAWFAARYWLKHLGQRRTPEIVIPPHVRARNRLIDALRLIHDAKPFCIAVSGALRVYLEERFDYHAPERTTDEFLEELQTCPLLSPAQKRSLADFLVRCDLVKFAKFEPTETELRDLHDCALRLVEETSPLAIAVPAATPANPAGTGRLDSPLAPRPSPPP
jgi:hypothetical protein